MQKVFGFKAGLGREGKTISGQGGYHFLAARL